MHVKVYTDGGNVKNPGPAAAAAVVVNGSGKVLAEAARSIGHATNNIAEYRGLLLGISLARLVGATHVEFMTDSQLMAQQVAMYWAIRDPELSRLHGYAESALDDFEAWSISYVPRSANARADWLCEQITRPNSRKSQKPAPVA